METVRRVLTYGIDLQERHNEKLAYCINPDLQAASGKELDFSEAPPNVNGVNRPGRTIGKLFRQFVGWR
jgi:hypothetical protein